ncbi:vomeronasal type-1 receptor 49-like isoform X2 [Bos taurus]|uniref:vomeronasal type-1 receptor 49-like isoform X2 n=1 Tax=Bos taurus TaxID=9913 RepID=UPI0028CB1AB0|nr:vomeronasal type-1 receptor 49-like isoform X2 [Bos taurus]
MKAACSPFPHDSRLCKLTRNSKCSCFCLSSIYMVTILFRHRKTAQHVRSTIQSPQGSPEIKATKVILMLVFRLILEKVEEPEIKVPTSAGSSKKQDAGSQREELRPWQRS